MYCRSSGDTVGDRQAGEEKDHGIVFPCLFTLHRATLCLCGQVDTIYFSLFRAVDPTQVIVKFGLARIVILDN